MCGSCGFFCIVLNLVDNREWVGWVGLLPTLIGKPVDELENLAWQGRISFKITIMQWIHAWWEPLSIFWQLCKLGCISLKFKWLQFDFVHDENLLLPRLWAVSGSVVQHVEESGEKEVRIKKLNASKSGSFETQLQRNNVLEIIFDHIQYKFSKLPGK